LACLGCFGCLWWLCLCFGLSGGRGSGGRGRVPACLEGRCGFERDGGVSG
jgi:hypothetical protein